MKNNLRAAGRFLRRVFLHNWVPKLVSLIFAVILWNYVILQTAPTRNVTLEGLNVTVVNANYLAQRELALSKPLFDMISDVKVTVSTRLQSVAQLTKDKITVTCDLSGIYSGGVHTVTLTARTTLGTIVSISPSSFPIEVETLASRSFPVEVVLTGDTAQGCETGTPMLDESKVTVTGPVAFLETVATVRATVDVTGLDADFSGSVPLEILDDDGQVVESTLLTLSDADVILTVPISHVVELPILVDAALIGKDALAQGYEIVSIEVYPETLTVRGTKEAVEQIQEAGGVSITRLDLTGAKEDVRTYVTASLPTGATLDGYSSNSTILVIIRISRKMTEISFEDMPIRIRNTPEDVTAAASVSTADIKVTGPELTMRNLTREHIQLYIDLSERTAGTFTVPIHVVLDDVFEATVSLTPSMVEVTLTETRK